MTYEEIAKQKFEELKKKDDVLILSIESSCDETSIALVKNGREVLSNIIASIADKVYGIEIVPQAVTNANQLAKINGFDKKIINICGDSAVELPKLAEQLNNQDFVTILDPPRKGCDPKVLEGLLKAKPSKIIYISCNPATLARDVALLKQNYKITLLEPYDMFPNTSHIETLVCLDRKEQK